MASPHPPENSERQRLDLALVARGHAKSRADAQELIRSGAVTVPGEPAAKASQIVSDADLIEVKLPVTRYASRGGMKLAAGLDSFAIPVQGKRCLDVGASTGGFTDCLLQRGAASVTAVDIGHGQMDPHLVSDPRVRHFEGVNARSIKPEVIGENPGSTFDIIAADLSFISLILVLPAVVPLLAPGGRLVLLIKPQFEVGREGLGKRGIVKDPSQREAAIAKVCEAANSLRLLPLGVMESPIAGGDGNREYLAAFANGVPLSCCGA